MTNPTAPAQPATRVLVQNARLAFPNLFTARSGEDGGKATFGCLLILTPDNPDIAKIVAAMKATAKAKWGDKAQAIYQQLTAQDRLALHDGITKSQYAGFEGNKFVSARSEGRPSVLNYDKSPLTEKDGRPYAGCYVNASIELWAQDHPKYGKRINAQLRGVQFVRDGDAFAAGTPASVDEFPDVSDTGGATSASTGEEPWE